MFTQLSEERAKGVPWKDLDNDGERTICTWYVGIISPRKEWSKEVWNGAEEERQSGIQGLWQLESPDKEYLEQVKRGDDTYCTERMMKKVFTALKSGDWEEYKGMFRV